MVPGQVNGNDATVPGRLVCHYFPSIVAGPIVDENNLEILANGICTSRRCPRNQQIKIGLLIVAGNYN